MIATASAAALRRSMFLRQHRRKKSHNRKVALIYACEFTSSLCLTFIRNFVMTVEHVRQKTQDPHNDWRSGC